MHNGLCIAYKVVAAHWYKILLCLVILIEVLNWTVKISFNIYGKEQADDLSEKS